jgi:HK97 gp10 family phage protein
MMQVAEVKGLKECEDFLKTLPDDVSKKMLVASLMSGAKPIMDQAKQNVQHNFGHSARYTYTLEEGLKRSRIRKTTLAAQVNVTLKKPKNNTKTHKYGVYKEYGDDPFYGRFLEFGTSKMQAKPFLLPAATARGNEATVRMRKTLMQRMARWCKDNGVTYRSTS